jgi:hypothetical protein
MKTKLLLGSVGAVAILILVSFTNVVSVQSTTSSSINDSPLFCIRTQNAINKNSKEILTSVYLGKGRNALQIPIPDNRTMMYLTVIDRIKRMDQTTFNNFITIVINQKNRDPRFKNVNSQEILTVLFQLKNDHNSLLNQSIEFNREITFIQLKPFPGCIILSIIFLIFETLFFFLAVLVSSLGGTCFGDTCLTCMLNSK